MAEPAFGLDQILGFIWLPMFIFLMLYGQKIQIFMMVRKVGKSLQKLEHMKVDARVKVTDALSEHNPDRKFVQERLDRLLQSFVIPPVSLDPKGVMLKLEHLLDTQDNALRDELKFVEKEADDVQLSKMENHVEVALGLNVMFKIVRHFYLSGKKSGSAFVIVQIQMLLPQIIEQAEAYHAALPFLRSGKPIGDGMGPLVASRLAGDAKSHEIVKDTMLAETTLEGRNLLIIKAKGPGGKVGKPGEAIRKLLEENKDISLVVTLDAALKLEGETSGEIAEGIGAAIGGPGVERYKIEDASTRHEVPMIALVTKMSEKEAITGMDEGLLKSVDTLMERFKATMLLHSKENDRIIVAGIGNTLGVP